MKTPVVLRVLGVAVILVLTGWIVMHTRWVEIDVDDPARGAAASDEDYVLRRIVESAGATLEVRPSLDPLPPTGATLWLESPLWNLFPERDAQLKAWVENGGRLVIGSGVDLRHESRDLAWIPLTSVKAASSAGPPGRAPAGGNAQQAAPKSPPLFGAKPRPSSCWNFTESASTATPAYERGRVFRACAGPFAIHALGHVVPTWTLALEPGSPAPFTADSRTLAMRVPVGRGDVTALTPFIAPFNRALLEGDNALVVVAALQAAPGRAIWIVRDERREPLPAWLWHEARTPSLLALAALALALWRLMVRFGPREAPPPLARRSMGEQVRGTGQFIAGTDPRALHAATRLAFDAVARTRVEDWAGLDDAARVAALAAALAHSHAINQPALLQSLNLGTGATPAQILAATAVLEQARRALLRTPPAPPAS